MYQQTIPQHILLNSDEGPDIGIVQVSCRHSKLSCVVVLLLPDWCQSEVTRAGEAARAPERRGATGESQSCQCPHSATGGESTTMCQTAADKWVNVDHNHICVSYVLAKNWVEKKSNNMNEKRLCMCVLSSYLLCYGSIFFRFTAGDDSDTNQTTAGSISQGAEWKHEQSLAGLLSDFSATEWNHSQNVTTQKRCT